MPSLRIAVFVHRFPALSETFVLNQLTALLDAGHEVDIFPVELGGADEAHRSVTEYGLLKRTFPATPISGKRIDRILHLWRDLPINKLKNFVRTLPLFNPQVYGRHAMSMRLALAAIPFLKEKKEYDLAYAHFETPANRMQMLAQAGLLKARHLVAALHTNFILQHRSSIPLMEAERSAFIGRTLKSLSLVMPISQYLAGELGKYETNLQKIVVHKMGVDLMRFQRLSASTPKSSKLKMIAICRLVEKKGMTYAIAACRLLKEAGLDCSLEIIGDGPLHVALQSQIARENLEEVVMLTGPQRQEQIIAKLGTADLLIAPSVTDSGGDCEGICVAIMEAMAMSLPVVASRHAGLPEIVLHGQTGLLIEERDVQGLADAVRKLAADSALRSEMGRAGRAFVEHHHDVEKLNRRLLELFQMVVSNRMQAS